MITDIMVNGFAKIYVERRGKLELTDARFRDNAHVMNVAQRIVTVSAAASTKPARYAMPGWRMAAGSTSSHRRWRSMAARSRSGNSRAKASPWTSWRGRGSGAGSLACSRSPPHAGSTLVISGGTGSGKTTLLNAMSQLIDPSERVMTIEDAAELQLQQPHVVRLETRPTNMEGQAKSHSVISSRMRCACAPIASSAARSRVRGHGHVAGDEYRPRRVDVHASCQ